MIAQQSIAVFAATIVFERVPALSSGSNASAVGRHLARNTEHIEVCQCSSGQHPWSARGEWNRKGQLHWPDTIAMEHKIGNLAHRVCTSAANGIRYNLGGVNSTRSALTSGSVPSRNAGTCHVRSRRSCRAFVWCIQSGTDQIPKPEEPHNPCTKAKILKWKYFPSCTM